MNTLHDRCRTGTVVCLTLLLGAAGPAFAAEYFVDFAAGSDTNPGTSQTAPWKHAPGDTAATGVPAAVALRAGNIVTFHGGVIYPDGLSLAASGTAAAPITYRGDAWGASPAVIDGGHTVSISIYLNANYLTVEGFELGVHGGPSHPRAVPGGPPDAGAAQHHRQSRP